MRHIVTICPCDSRDDRGWVSTHEAADERTAVDAAVRKHFGAGAFAVPDANGTWWSHLGRGGFVGSICCRMSNSGAASATNVIEPMVSATAESDGHFDLAYGHYYHQAREVP